MTRPDQGDEQARQERRAWILSHHPDHGGDAEAFAAGLRDRSAPQPAERPRVTVARHRRIRRRVISQLRQLIPGAPPTSPPRVR